MSLIPPDKFSLGLTSYAHPLLLSGYARPSIAVNIADPDPHTMAVITIAGDPLTDRGRSELMSATLSALKTRIDGARLHVSTDRWTEF